MMKLRTRLEKKLKHEDPIELPMDEKFYEHLHARIMSSIEKTELKPLSRWAKTWVFLEAKAKPKSLAKKIIKTSFVGLSLSMALGLARISDQNENDSTTIVELDHSAKKSF